jgi:hypothetical protein
MTWTGKPLTVDEDEPVELDPIPTPAEEEEILAWIAQPLPKAD